MEPISPVIPGLEALEVVYAKDQEQYRPLPCIRTEQGMLVTRWNLTPEERDLIASGADIYLNIHTFNQLLQPVNLRVVSPTMASCDGGVKKMCELLEIALIEKGEPV